MLAADVAVATGDHDRLVIAAHAAVGQQLLVAAEVAGQHRTAELVAVAGGTDRAVEHDLQRAGDARRLAEVLFPGLHETGNPQVRHREAGQAGLRATAAAGGRFVADFAAGAGGGTRCGRDAGRMVVRLDLHQDVHRLAVLLPHPIGFREEAHRFMTLDHRRVVLVGGQHTFRRSLVGQLDHAEQRVRLNRAIDREFGVEDLVPAVLAVDLREHHQLGIGRVLGRAGVMGNEVIDLVTRQRQTPVAVGVDQRLAATGQHIDGTQRPTRSAGEHVLQIGGCSQHRFGHRIVQVGECCGRKLTHAVEQIQSAAFDALHTVQPADFRDVGGLARPRAQGADARHDVERAVGSRQRIGRRLQQPAQRGFVDALRIDHEEVQGPQAGDAGCMCRQARAQALDAKRRQGGTAGEDVQAHQISQLT